MIHIGDTVQIRLDETLLRAAGLEVLLESIDNFNQKFVVLDGCPDNWYRLDNDDFDDLRFPPGLLIQC